MNTNRSDFKQVRQALRKRANPSKAKLYARFFKTGKGEYGEGDTFLGLTVPEQRTVAYRFLDLSLSDNEKLLKSPYHEDRFTALEILVAQYERGDDALKKRIATYYLAHTKYINNWDLVDTSASYILGHYLFDKEKKILHTLSKSRNLWERRIAIVATGYGIGRLQYDDTIIIAERLLNDDHDLIHKAVGWMLREVGKRNVKKLEDFLRRHAHRMPRTMLRYAIEKFPKSRRKQYLDMKIIAR